MGGRIVERDSERTKQTGNKPKTADHKIGYSMMRAQPESWNNNDQTTPIGARTAFSVERGRCPDKVIKLTT
jgi:hypothetical protein